MARLFCCLLLTVLCASLGKPQNQPPPISAQPQGLDQKIEDVGTKMRVDGKIVAQTYCAIGPREFLVSMKISLRFTNLSDRPIILSRKIPQPIAVHVAKNPEALRIRNFEYNPSFDWTVAELPKSPSLGNVPDSEYFTILPAGESFETHVSSWVVGTQKRKEGLVGKGKHVLQLGVETWPCRGPFYTPIDAHTLAGQWSKYGHLVTGIVYTEPIPFIVPDKVGAAACE